MKKINKIIATSVLATSFAVAVPAIQPLAAHANTVSRLTQHLNPHKHYRGQKLINGHWYYFNDRTGNVVTGFKYIASQHKTVYYNTRGQMIHGQQSINGHRYYFDDKSGAEVKGWKYIPYQNKMVYYNGNGWMLYNTQRINNVTYTFDKHSGALKGQDAASLKLSQASFAKKTHQAVVTVANNTTSASVALYNKDRNGIWTKTLGTNGYVGSQGVGSTHEGLSRTPQGAYSLGFAFGTHPRASTSLRYRHIDRKSYWIEDPRDSNYNTWQERTWANSNNEHLMNYPVQYEYAIVINYNTAKRTKGAGSGFFLHVANGRPTAGCVSVPRSVMLSLLRRIKSGAYIVNVNSTNQISNY